MIDNLIAFLAPHPCVGCNKQGDLLCANCKYDIISEPFSACAACGKNIAGTNGICSKCTVYYQCGWCVADRRDQLERLINAYKFTNVRAGFRPLADLLDERLPQLPENTVIVPIPTISSHIRQRGYDHMMLIARRLGRLRKLPVVTSLRRVTNTTQRGSDARERARQAKEAFACRETLERDKIYLLVDDVITSGSTVKYAAKTLLDVGANTVWVASISRQPVDK